MVLGFNLSLRLFCAFFYASSLYGVADIYPGLYVNLRGPGAMLPLTDAAVVLILRIPLLESKGQHEHKQEPSIHYPESGTLLLYLVVVMYWQQPGCLVLIMMSFGVGRRPSSSGGEAMQARLLIT